jgi:SET domain-containing protein
MQEHREGVKRKLLNELTFNTYAKLGRSNIEGIGVFAITDIPKGCTSIFSDDSMPQEEWVKVLKTEVESLPNHSKELIENYCLYDEDCFYVPSTGFKKLDLVVFLNHSETPNLKSVNDGAFFVALTDIKKGEELLIDYGEIVDETI